MRVKEKDWCVGGCGCGGVGHLIYIAVTVPTSENISQGVQGKCKSEFAKSNTRTYAHVEEGGKTHLSPYTHITH